MRLIAILLTLLAVGAFGAVGVVAATSASAPAVASTSPPAKPVLLAFGGRGFGGGLFGRRRSYYGGYPGFRYRHPILHHIGRALFWGYVLHLFFSSGVASLLIWFILIALVVHFVGRRRRRRYSRLSY